MDVWHLSTSGFRITARNGVVFVADFQVSGSDVSCSGLSSRFIGLRPDGLTVVSCSWLSSRFPGFQVSGFRVEVRGAHCGVLFWVKFQVSRFQG